jgi:hypothetical protein
MEPGLAHVSPMRFIRPTPILSPPERKLFRSLHLALSPAYHICPQVAFSGFVTHDPALSLEAARRVRKTFNTRRPDHKLENRAKDDSKMF